MPAKEIKELRQNGKLQEAFVLAKAELDSQPENIWSKRNLSWVLYDFLKQNTSAENYELFKSRLAQITDLRLPGDEKMLFDQVAWQIGKMIFQLTKAQSIDISKVNFLLDRAKNLAFTKPSDGYSFLFKAFHKALKDNNQYIDFADWWNFENFQSSDYLKEKLPDDKEVMAIVEQAVIAYSKHLLPHQSFNGEVIFNREKAIDFIPFLDKIIETHPDYQYPAYFKGKLLLAVGDPENMLSAILPFAKKKRNDFWVWDILSEAFSGDEQKRIACYCRALTCNTSDDFLINLRQKIAHWFITQTMYDEAKTEIDKVIKARTNHEWKIPNEIKNWTEQTWYNSATIKKSNFDFYKKYFPITNDILYSDIPEETIIIDFVNLDKKIANFIASDKRFGFFKYDRFINTLNVGDTAKVRFDGNGSESHFKLFTLEKCDDESFRNQYIKSIEGEIRISEGKAFGFLLDAFIHPSIIKKYSLQNKQSIKGVTMKSYNSEKKVWGWKLLALENTH